MTIRPEETEIRGSWIRANGEVVADETCRRIDQLVSTHLEKVGRDATGWDTPYRDPADGRYWKLIYPQSDLHGGGPPTLRQLRPDEVHAKYGIV